MKVFSLIFTIFSITALPLHASDLLTVYKDANCGCCSKWIEHMQLGGFKVKVINQDPDLLQSTKDRYKIPTDRRSCHTGIIGNYVFEGHIPVDIVTSYLKSGSKGFGLAVPGMPLGSPGMEFGNKKHKYDIYELLDEKKSKVFHTINPKK